jgi:hypothetical protein
VAEVIAEMQEVRGHRATATPDQEADLRELVGFVAADWPDREEALAVALADPADALICFRALAHDMRPLRAKQPASPYTSVPLSERDPTDERRTCNDCANLSPIGRCLAAARGKRIHASRREYYPIADLLGRCEHFSPLPNDPDQRRACDRWPHSILPTDERNAA